MTSWMNNDSRAQCCYGSTTCQALLWPNASLARPSAISTSGRKHRAGPSGVTDRVEICAEAEGRGLCCRRAHLLAGCTAIAPTDSRRERRLLWDSHGLPSELAEVRLYLQHRCQQGSAVCVLGAARQQWVGENYLQRGGCLLAPQRARPCRRSAATGVVHSCRTGSSQGMEVWLLCNLTDPVLQHADLYA